MSAIILFINQAVFSQSEEETVFGFKEAFPEIHAYLATEIENFENKKNADFHPHELYLNISSQLRKNLKAIIEWEYEHGGDKIRVTRVLSEWQLASYFGVKIGKDMVPFSIAERVHYVPVNLRKNVEHPFALMHIVPMAWRETGLFLFGKIPVRNMQLKYDFAIVNGLGEKALTDIRNARQNEDNNDNKFITGRLEFLPFTNIELGVSYATGKYDNKAENTMQLWGGHLIYDKDPLNIVGEYITSTLNDTLSITRNGLYIQAGYKFFQKKELKHLRYVEPVLRFDNINTNTLVNDNSDRYRISVGAVIVPYEHFKFRIDYYHVQEMYAPTIANNGIAAHVVIDF